MRDPNFKDNLSRSVASLGHKVTEAGQKGLNMVYQAGGYTPPPQHGAIRPNSYGSSGADSAETSGRGDNDFWAEWDKPGAGLDWAVDPAPRTSGSGEQGDSGTKVGRSGDGVSSGKKDDTFDDEWQDF